MLEKIFEKLRTYIELNIFGVCSYLGQKLGIPSHRIRLFFIYASFIAAGSSIIIYLCLAFIVNIRNYIKTSKRAIWD